MSREPLHHRIIAALLAVATLALVGLALHLDGPRVVPLADAVCVTDTDCQELCDPADKECDGGPES